VGSPKKPSLLEYKPQDYGEDPIAVRDTDQYTDEYVRGFVEKWDELIDWDQRAESEGSFFIDALRDRGVRRVLDVATAPLPDDSALKADIMDRAAYMRLFTMGVILLLVLRFSPRGLLPER